MFFCEFHHLKVIHFRTFPSPLAHCSLYQTSDGIICQKFQRKALIELWEPKVVIMPRGKQAPPARGEEEASSDDSMSSGFLTHSTLDEQRFTLMFALSRNDFNFFFQKVPEVQNCDPTQPSQKPKSCPDEQVKNDGKKIHRRQGTEEDAGNKGS